MSDQNQPVKEKNSLRDSAQNLNVPTHQPTPPPLPTQPSPAEWRGEMTRSQALAVSWTGLGALAENNQLTIINDLESNSLWIGIANAKFDVKMGEVLDLLELPTHQPTPEGEK